MLDLIRKKSQSWIVKALFLIIILVFVFFFGYSQMSNQALQKDTVAMVNDLPVLRGEFTLAFENMNELYKQIYPDGIPQNMTKMIEESTLSQLINKKILVDYASKNNILVTDGELYYQISHSPGLQEGGQFDPIRYKKSILPYYRQRYGVNIEKIMKEDMLYNKVKALLEDSVVVSSAEVLQNYQETQRERTLKVVKVVDNSDNASANAEAIQALLAKKAHTELSSLLKHLNVATETITVSLKNRAALFDPMNTEAWKEVFSLSESSPTLKGPIHIENTYYAIALDSLSQVDMNQWEKEKKGVMEGLLREKQTDYFQNFLANLSNKASIETYITFE